MRRSEPGTGLPTVQRLLLCGWANVLACLLFLAPASAEMSGSLVIAGNGPELATFETLARASRVLHGT